MSNALANFQTRLNKLLELIYLIQKDISGVRLRSSLVIQRKEFSDQVDQVIRMLNNDINNVESGMKNLKRWLIYRKNAINSIDNLYNSIERTINESKTVKEVKDRIKMFGKSAQQEFVLSLLNLEDLWFKGVQNTMNSMQKVTSIMQVTQEKINRYKQEYGLNPEDLTSKVDSLFNYLIGEKFEEFDELEKRIRSSILPQVES